MRYYLVSFFGTFVCRDLVNGTLAQIQLAAITDRDSLVSLDLPSEIERPVYQDFISNRSVGTAAVQVRDVGQQILHIDYVRKTISLEHDGQYLSAQPNGSICQDRTWVLGWERFVLCSDEDLDFLFFLQTHTWIVKSTRAVISGHSLRIGEEAVLEFADLRIPLALNMPLDRRTFPFRWLPLVDGWRIEELVLFKPMIYYIAFGEDTLAQLYINLRSLAQIGHYGGRVLVFSDRTNEQIRERVPWLAPSQIDVSRVPAQDKVGYIAGRYCILEEPKAHQYQPVVYMDTDIVFNADVEPLLVAMAVSDRLTAPLEPFSELAQNPSVGAELLQLDNAQPCSGNGFNCGTIGIPNLPMHAHTLELIRRIVSNLSSIHGRNSFRWVDQPVANYVSYKHAHFDTNDVSQAVRYGSREDATRLGPLSGLVHFWRDRPADRAEVMQQYLSLLLSQLGIPTSSERTSGRSRPDIVFLCSPKYLRFPSTILRSNQLHRIVAETFADREHDVICTTDEGVRDAFVVLSKGFLMYTDVEAIRGLKARGNILVADFIDWPPDLPIVAEIDGLMASSHRQYEYLRSTFPDKPCHLVTHHVDTRIPKITPPTNHLRVGYFGALYNARHRTELRDLVAFVSAGMEEVQWISELANYNCHYGLRADQSWDGFKPFLKGFTAAHCGAPIITEIAEGDARYYLPLDYPFFVAARDADGVAETIHRTAQTFGGPEWRYACDVMREIRERSSVPAVIREFEVMVSEYLRPV